MPLYDTLWTNARLATMVERGAAYGAIEDGALASRNGTIAYVGSRVGLAGPPERMATRVIDAGGRWITPGLVDPHTHLIFGGDRVADFERRVAGQTYAAAAHGGSGIAHTVAMTRAQDEETLYASALVRLRALIASGATTVEVKSGYGLDIDTELRQLRVARRLGRHTGITVRVTYLGAHIVPPEYTNRREAYLDLVCGDMLPRIVRDGLADAVDVFCDRLAFTPREAGRVFDAARTLGLRVKLHADQLSDTGGALLAAQHAALSADHLEFAGAAGIAAMAQAGTVAVVLPGAYYYLGEARKPPLAALRASGVPIALASDCNPGSSPIVSLGTVMNLACVLFGMGAEEAVTATTRNAARALGLEDRGVLREGARCDLALWDVASPAELCYWLGGNRCAGVVVAGEPL